LQINLFSGPILSCLKLSKAIKTHKMIAQYHSLKIKKTVDSRNIYFFWPRENKSSQI